MSGKNIPRPRRVMEPEDFAKRNRKIADAIRSGATMADLRGRFGLSENALRRIRADMGMAGKQGCGRRWS